MERQRHVDLILLVSVGILAAVLATCVASAQAAPSDGPGGMSRIFHVGCGQFCPGGSDDWKAELDDATLADGYSYSVDGKTYAGHKPNWFCWFFDRRGSVTIRCPKGVQGTLHLYFVDLGNSGPGARLLMGIVAGHPMTVEFTGDASLSRRPMGRVLTPLKQMGLEVLDGDRETLPLTVRGSSHLVPIEYRLPVPSAQVKSATLIAGLMARGETTILEAEPTRDHTERMLRYLGAEIVVSKRAGGLTAITIGGDAELAGRDITVPGDPSSAAFLIAAACLVPGSDVTVEGVLVNQTRSGFYRTLAEMGADIEFLNEREEGGEVISDIRARYGELAGVTVPPERAPSMIDEYPILAVVASFARGETHMRGLAELKVKESDRLAATAAGLRANGVDALVEGDDLIVTGARGVPGGGTVATHLDHRIAMSFLVLGLASQNPVQVEDGRMIQTSFTGFEDLMRGIGADIHAAPVAD